MDQITYKLILEHPSVNLKEIFDKFTTMMARNGGVELTSETSEKVVISYSTAPFKATLEFRSNQKEESEVINPEILLTTDRTDTVTLQLTRYEAYKFGLKVFSPTLGCFLPDDPRFTDMSQIILDPEVKSVIESFGFTPIFYIQGTKTIYAKSSNGEEIYFLNNHLIDHFTEPGAIKENSDELSYPVAPDLKTFVAFADRQVIPEKFYEYYKRSIKIFNYSGFNIRNPGRKVFVKPYIFELDNEKQGFYMIAKDGSSILRMDKILKDETLDDTLRRVLKDLKIGDDYLKAKVLEEVEFDRDKEGRLTPRLKVMIFMEKIENREEITKKAAQKWIPLGEDTKPE